MMKGCSFGLVLWACSVALAEPMVFATRAEFEAAVQNVAVQGFEAQFETAVAVSFPGFTVAEDSPFANVTSRTDYVSAGQRSLGFTWNGERTLTFTFNDPIDAFAADILDFGTCCGAMALNIVSDTGELNQVAAVGGDLPRGNLQFLGVTTDQPFKVLSFTSDQNSDNDLIVFDEVAFRSVPEPEGIVLVVAAGAWLLTVRRRDRR
jgi:hypothetical protein